MHSIRTRIMSLTMTAILVSVLALGSISVVSVRQESDRNSAETMRLLCDNCCYSIEQYLSGIQQSVDMVSRYAEEELSTAELTRADVVGLDGKSGEPEERNTVQQKRLNGYLQTYLGRVEDVFRSVANHTNGVIAFYYRINPELSMESKGFLYSKVGSSGFAEVPLTKLEDFEPDDAAHVGWYYIPLERGEASWLDPYENENLGIKMLSYVKPLYLADTFIGVIGMDISYETLIDLIKDIRIYDTGYAYLMREDGVIVYHPWLPDGISLARFDPQMKDAVAHLDRETSNVEPLRYVVEGIAKQMFFGTLSSGLKLIVTAPVREIETNGRQLGDKLLMASVAILLVFSTLTAVIMRRLTGPLKRMTEAAEHLAEGNYDVELDYSRKDEIGTLTRAFQQLMDHLKLYISDLNSKAYQDALTGVKNKAAYDASARKLNDMIRMAGSESQPQFALVMFDCNDLKKINDTYGHEKGDIYLRTACALICGVFPHSPVFRMGGDEFATILQGEPYGDREALLSLFDRDVEVINAVASDPWRYVHIAKGIAVYDPSEDDGVETVLHRADEMMYEDKKRYKAGRK